MQGIIRNIVDAGTPDGTLSWSPQFDMRNIGVETMRLMLQIITSPQGIAIYGGPPGKLANALQLFTAGVNNYLQSDTDESLEAHLIAAGFRDASPGAVAAIFGVLGCMFVAQFSLAMTHATTTDGMDLPYQPVLAKFLAETKVAAEQLFFADLTYNQPEEPGDAEGQNATNTPMP